MNGASVAVLGAGRSGVAVAEAAIARGAQVNLYDAKPLEKLGSLPTTLADKGIGLVYSFAGPFTTSEADILVTSPGVDSRSEVLLSAMNAGFEVISEIEFAYRIATVPIVAITGTNGKSTTTVMTHELIKSNAPSVLCGNIFGSGYDEVSLTEAAAGAKSGYLVAEISSFQLEWIRQFKPRLAAITNITPDHLNRYENFEHYAQTKRNIYRNMAESDLYVHHEDPLTTPAPGHRFRSCVTHYDDKNIYLPTKPVPLDLLPSREQYTVQNAALALSLFSSIEEFNDATLDHSVETALTRFKGLSHRMERIGERHGVAIVNNSMCTNPRALIASSSGVLAHQHLLIGGMTKDLDFSSVGEYLARSGHDAYLFGTDGNKINSKLGGLFPVYTTMAEAFHAAIRCVKSGEVVMLAPGCASMDQFSDFRTRGDEFKLLAKEWLQDEQAVTR